MFLIVRSGHCRGKMSEYIVCLGVWFYIQGALFLTSFFYCSYEIFGANRSF